MRQYKRIKEKCPEAVLFFRMGDFYEMFFEDARLASKVLGIALTSRTEGIPMAGVPHHAAETYIRRMIKAGYKVAVCDQLQDPSEAKVIVERDITRIITPGTLTEETMLEAKEPNYLAGLCWEGGKVGLAYAELSTGRFTVEEISFQELADELVRISPSELLLPEGAETQLINLLKETLELEPTYRPALDFERDNAERTLCEHFEVSSLEGYGCEGLSVGLCAGGAVISYLQETQRVALPHIRRIQLFERTRFVQLGANAIRSLELLETLRTRQKEGSLLWTLDRTVTPMGGRLMREWILAPLKDPEAIKERLSAVEELVENPSLRSSLRSKLKQIQDLERLSSRLACQRINPRELLQLRHSIELLPSLLQKLDGTLSPLLAEVKESIDTLEDVGKLIGEGIVEDPPVTVRDGGIIRKGYNPELDQLRSIQHDGKRWLAQYQMELVRSTHIDSLKLGYNKVFGYYIEVPNAHLSRVPSEFIPVQTLKNAQRYTTPELREHEAKFLRASERSKELEYELFQQIREKVKSAIPRLQGTARSISALDVLCAFAEVAVEGKYTRPVVDNSLEIEIKKGRHPCLERTLLEPFVPNDCLLNPRNHLLLVITGPNMVGKSTYIRQVALITLLAQIGSFVPAESARIGVVDKIFTRVGAADELARGQSTFMVEMVEVANILNNATERSLIILDEVGRGTSTFDGLSIAWAVSEYIVQRLKARTLFATHYHQLTELASSFPHLKNFNIAVKEWRGQLIFLHRIVEGGTDKSYGIQVARLAGVPQEVVERSRKILDVLESASVDSYGRPRLVPNAPGETNYIQLTLFDSGWNSIIKKIRDVDINSITPLQALQFLEELKREIEE